VRRNEVCEYPSLDENEPTRSYQWRDDLILCGTNGTLSPVIKQSPPFSSSLEFWIRKWEVEVLSSRLGNIEASISYNASLHLLEALFAFSWFTPKEQSLLVPALAKMSTRYQYLQRCILALVNLREFGQQASKTGTKTAAYQHQVESLSIFRASAPVINDQNWLAILVFSTGTLVFQFFTQSFCGESEFDIMETMHILRSTAVIERSCEPYYRQSPYWELFNNRTEQQVNPPDLELALAFEALSEYILIAVNNQSNDEDEEEFAEINRQAFGELQEWAISCNAKPKRWRQYCEWPAKVMPEYFDLIVDGDDVAIVIFIHWVAMLHESNKPSVIAWSERAAFWATTRLQADWSHLLAWPLQLLKQDRPIKRAGTVFSRLSENSARQITPGTYE
jgi:hypothetical protein